MIALGLIGTTGVGVLLNVTSGAIDPKKAPFVMRLGWFGIAVWFPVYLILISPLGAWLGDSWRRAKQRWLWAILGMALAGSYLLLALLCVDEGLKRLRQQPAGIQLSVSLLPNIPADGLDLRVTGATFVFQNPTDDTLREQFEYLRVPPAAAVTFPDPKEFAKMELLNFKPGTQLIQVQVHELRKGRFAFVEVQFIDPHEYTSDDRWKAEFGYGPEVWVYRWNPVGPFVRVKPFVESSPKLKE